MSELTRSNWEYPITARAALSSYIALMGIWMLLGLGIEWVAFNRPGRNDQYFAALCLVISLLWFIWLRGFRLFLYRDRIEYRDGFFRSISLSLKDITDVKNSWVAWSMLGTKLRAPRLLLVYGPRKYVAVNTKPFWRSDLQSIVQGLLQRTNAG